MAFPILPMIMSLISAQAQQGNQAAQNMQQAKGQQIDVSNQPGSNFGQQFGQSMLNNLVQGAMHQTSQAPQAMIQSVRQPIQIPQHRGFGSMSPSSWGRMRNG